MEVIKQPTRQVVKDPLYEVQCPIDYAAIGDRGCGAVLRFKKSEIIRIIDQRDGDAEYIVCPCCGKIIWNTNFRFRIVEENMK